MAARDPRRTIRRTLPRAALYAAGLTIAVQASARDDVREAPISDTEDAGLGSQAVGDGRLHVILGLDVRNGDFVRGSYDDDAANLSRLPVHAQLGLVYELTHDGNEPTAWLELRSSNGFHAPNRGETTSPRAWYESNNLVGVAARLAPGLNGAVTYAIKSSPNGVSATTHELSAAVSLDGSGGFARLNPGFVATWRPQGGDGLYTQAMIEPGVALGDGGQAGRLSLPATFGIGWNGFYAANSGTRLFGSVGLAYTHPLTIGGAHFSLRAEASALVRDNRLRRLDPASAGRQAVRPFATLALTYAY